MYFKKIEGERIYLSPIDSNDIEKYVAWLSDNNITDNLGNSSVVFNILNEQQWIEDVNKNGNYQFAIIKKDDNSLIGNCGFNKVDNINQDAEIGIFIGDEENRNKGYGSEALKLLIGFGYDYLNLNNIMLKVFAFNERAIKAYKKIGFKEFGTRHKCSYIKGQFVDEIFMEIVKEDYKK